MMLRVKSGQLFSCISNSCASFSPVFSACLQNQWAAEKWKFQEGNTLQFYNKLTRGFICLSPDSRVDALGDKKSKYGKVYFMWTYESKRQERRALEFTVISYSDSSNEQELRIRIVFFTSKIYLC